MDRASFSYVLYIHAIPEQVWDGLLKPDFTRRYWFHDNVSDWKPGSDWSHRRSDEEGAVDIAGQVLESDPPHRLVLSWARPDDVEDPEKTSRVAVEISPQSEWPMGPWTCLRLEHSKLEHDREMFDSISFGWPSVLSGLKSILERPDIFVPG